MEFSPQQDEALKAVARWLKGGRPQIFRLFGYAGTGKTTLARLLNGLVRPTRGRVTVDGRDVADERREVQRRVGFVFANADHQIVYPTPVEDVALGLRARGVSRTEARDRALAVLEEVGIADRAEQAVHTLSGGEKHLVALAAVLVLQPDWLVIDEPTTTPHPLNPRRVVDVLLSLPHRLVIVTHDLDLAEAMDHALLGGGHSVHEAGVPAGVIECYRRMVGA